VIPRNIGLAKAIPELVALGITLMGPARRGRQK